MMQTNFSGLLCFPAFWKRQPVRLRALFNDIYIIQGAKPQLALMKQSSLSTFFIHRTFLSNVFQLPKAAAETYGKDKSGDGRKPHAESLILHRNRGEFHLHSSRLRLLTGPGQASLFHRLDGNARDRLSLIGVEDDWTHLADFLNIFKHHLTAAAVDSLAGPALMARHANFAHDLWSIDENILGFLLKLPRFLNLAGHRQRDRALDAVQDWHAWARDNFYPESIDEEGNDPFWGSAFFRDRQQLFSNMDGFDSRAMASEDLAFIWSAQFNAIMSTFWITLEAFQDAELLREVREEVRLCTQTEADGRLRIDPEALLRQPLLQAMFAENLRLHVHGFLPRYSGPQDLCIDNWTIPRDSICISSLTSASMDPEFWGKGRGAEHAVDEFWPGRFTPSVKT
ncbi:hypothetical protein CDD81_155 [Ophiocordyceps australis]|uniref:Uncharacterized protein n=1 Tax=Ophiocordyceps australis TaxID=1399860 RepID=A0A2C5YCZ6_9HYPO|nr:hypothetical protein CDD81_155 [Ophiocordyceps australis]